MKVPTYATHYYLSESGPFRSLSDIKTATENSIFKELLTRHKRDSGYRRRFGTDYIEKRRSIESELRELFIDRGGKPQRQNPFYMVLGESTWFHNLNSNHEALQIPLSSLDPKTTSITFPDSFIALTKAEKPFYKKVYLLSEVQHVWTQYSMPRDESVVPYEGYWNTEFEIYVEIQVWAHIDLSCLTSRSS